MSVALLTLDFGSIIDEIWNDGFTELSFKTKYDQKMLDLNMLLEN